MMYADDANTNCPDIPTVPAFLASLDSFDAMADMLDADALAVPLDLLLSTTTRTLRALGAFLSASLASSSCSRSTSLSGSSSGSGMGSSFVSTNTRERAEAASGVRDPLRALALLDASLHRVLCTVFSSLAAHYPSSTAELRGAHRSSTQITQIQAQAALDDVLGSLYALILTPLVRAFAPASQVFVSACLLSSSSSSSSSSCGFGSGSGSGISYGDEYPLPGSGGNSDTDKPRERDNDKDDEGPAAIPDLRPVVFDVLERALSALEDQCLQLVRPGSSGADAGSRAGDGESSTGDGGHTCELRPQSRAIPGVREVKRLLALDCVRELERMYASAPATTSLPSYDRDAAADSEMSEDHPDTNANIRRRSDEAPGGSAGTRQEQGALPHSLPRSLPLLALWPGSARTCAPMRKAHAHVSESRAGADRTIRRDRNQEGSTSGGGCECASEDPTRPGTPASPAATTSPALGPLRPQAQARSPAQTYPQASEGRTRGAAGPPRSAGNLGEIRADDTGAALGLGFAHAQDRSARGDGEGEDRDLRGDEEDDDGLGLGLGMGKRFRERVVRLARKDTAWYLCAILSRLLPRGTPSNGDVTPGSSTGADARSSSVAPDPSRLEADAANSNKANPRENASVKPNRKLSLTKTDDADDTDTIADEAVYAALVDLLRRSRPAQSPFLLPGRRGGGGSDPSSARADTVDASILDHDHGGGPSAGGADRYARQHAYRDPRDGDFGLGLGLGNGTAAMGEVERGMLLAVFERAWLGT
ncbi:hypothetical protein V8D89_004090 [Ganoderma adspersum]